MKKHILILSLLALAGLNSCKDSSLPESSFQEVYPQFQNPPANFRPAPLWVWNTDVTTADIDRMLGELSEQGFGGALVHPRPGLVTEYLSDEWFRLWKYSLQKGKELGLEMGIYDENSYPSGFAGGHVPDQMPESYNQGQALIGKRTNLPPLPDECFMCIERKGDEYHEITDRLAEYKGREGDFYVYTLGSAQPSDWTAGYPYVDLLVKGVTEKFIDVTMGAYEKALGPDYGTSVTLAFSDEPHIVSPYGGHCRWTPDLFDCFQQMWGYSLREKWPLLGDEVGDWQKVRHDYNATLLRMFIERWSKPWHEYAEKKNMIWTGHYWEHNWPDLSSGPDNMAMYAWHQMPGIDMLFNQFNDSNCQAQFGNVRSVKELRSVANQIGQRRTLCETYGGAGWDERFQDFKRLGDWEYALGVNYMNQHLCHMTITGSRKYDYPPVFTSLSPWWQEYGTLNDYFARLSVALSYGEQKNDWLIMEPTTTLWLYYTAVAGGDPLWKTANAFQRFVTKVEKAQIEYDLGSEEIIRTEGSISGNRFRIGKRDYGTVVLPPEMVNLESATYELLQRFVDKGGRLICFSQPTKIDGRNDERLSKLFHTGQNAAVIQMTHPDELEVLYLQEATAKVSVLQGNDVYHHRRIYKDGQLLFLVNSSEKENAQVEFSLPGKYLYQLDPMTGEMGTCQDCSITLLPAGSALFFASDKEWAGVKKNEILPQKTIRDLQPEDNLCVVPLKQNALTLDFCDIQVGSAQAQGLYTPEANGWLWKQFGMSDPWERAVQFRQNIVQRDTFSTGDVWVRYPFIVDNISETSQLQAIIERPDVWKVFLNDSLLNDWSTDSLLDSRCGLFNLEKRIKPGNNCITLHLEKMSIMAEVAPVILTGNFILHSAQRGFTIDFSPATMQLGSWAKQGLPMYAWGVAYKTEYVLENLQNHHFYLQMGQWNGTLAQVFVNDQRAGIVLGQSDELELTPFLQEGTNKVEVRVFGSLKNLYGPHYSHEKGIMGPWSWSGVKEQQPGSQYDVLDYGLMEPYTIVEKE